MKLFELITQPQARTEPVTPPGSSLRMSPAVLALFKSDQLETLKQAVANIPPPDQQMYQQVLKMMLSDIMNNNPQAATDLLNAHIRGSHQNKVNPNLINFKAKGGLAAWEAFIKFVAAVKDPKLTMIKGRSVPQLVSASISPEIFNKLTLLENEIKKILS